MKVFTLSVGDYHSKKYSKFNKEIDLTVCTNSNEYWNHYNTISVKEWFDSQNYETILPQIETTLDTVDSSFKCYLGTSTLSIIF